MLKRFDPEMHHKVDEPARDATKSYISKHGHTAMDHDDKYSVDLIVPGVCYIECECKLVWMTDTFEYKTIHIPKRKKKFADLDMPCLFFVWNKQFTRAIRLHSGYLQDQFLTEIKNRIIPDGEYFYDVPMKYASIITK